MTTAAVDLVVLYEHPEWQKPLFEALTRRGVAFAPFDLTRAAFHNDEAPRARLYFNQASPSAYLRGHTRAVPLALAYMRSLELLGARVLNGANVFALELSKSVQATLLRTLGIDTPRSITFNDPAALHQFAGDIGWPAVLKPDQGGSGARIQVVESLAEIDEIFRRDPSIWLPDNLFLLQDTWPRPRSGHRPPRIRRRRAPLRDAREDPRTVQPVSLSGVQPGRRRLGLRPARRSRCRGSARRVLVVPRCAAGRGPTGTADCAGCRPRRRRIEYLETVDGRRVFYDINANSNLRPSVAAEFGFNPFERVVDYLVAELRK